MSLAEFLMQPLVLITAAAGIIGAIIIIKVRSGDGGLFGSSSKKYVLLLRNKDRKFKRIKIINETDEALEAPKEKNGVTRFFIKRGPGWTDDEKPQTMFLGFNAYAYTLQIGEAKQEILRLAEAVKIVLGREVYDVIQPDLRDKLEKAKLGISIEPEDPATTGATLTGNETRHTVSDEKMIDYYADKNAKAMQGNKVQWPILIAGLAGGVVLGIILVSSKVINLG